MGVLSPRLDVRVLARGIVASATLGSAAAFSSPISIGRPATSARLRRRLVNAPADDTLGDQVTFIVLASFWSSPRSSLAR